MLFRNFPKELPAILEKPNSINRNFQVEWKKHIIREINNAMPLDMVAPEDDLTQFALYRLMQRYYFERGEDGVVDVFNFWARIIEKHEKEREQIETPH